MSGLEPISLLGQTLTDLWKTQWVPPESFFGKSVNFEDNTNSPNLPNRKFKSLEDYGQETSNSWVYGGIHYDFSCKKGYESGKIIGKNILALNFKK